MWRHRPCLLREEFRESGVHQTHSEKTNEMVETCVTCGWLQAPAGRPKGQSEGWILPPTDGPVNSNKLKKINQPPWRWMYRRCNVLAPFLRASILKSYPGDWWDTSCRGAAALTFLSLSRSAYSSVLGHGQTTIKTA